MSGTNKANERLILRQARFEALSASHRRIAPSAKAIATDVKSGKIGGATAAALRLLASVRAPVPAKLRASIATDHWSKAASERELIARLAPQALGVPGKDPFQLALTFLEDAKDFKGAQKLLDSRAEAMKEFFDSWSESMAENAKLDREAAERAHQRAAIEKKVSQVRHKFNTYLTQQGVNAEQLIPAGQRSSWAPPSSVGAASAPRPRTVRRNSRASRRSEVVSTDSFEVAGKSAPSALSHTPTPEQPDTTNGVNTRPTKRAKRASLR